MKDFRLTERAIGSLAACCAQVGSQLPAESKILNPAQSDPESLWAGVPIAFASQEATEGSDHPDHFVQRRRALRWTASFDDHPGRLPFVVFKDDATG